MNASAKSINSGLPAVCAGPPGLKLFAISQISAYQRNILAHDLFGC